MTMPTLYELLEDAYTALLALNRADDEEAWMGMHDEGLTSADFEAAHARLVETRKDYEAAVATARSFAGAHGLHGSSFQAWQEIVFSCLNLKSLQAEGTNNADAWAGNVYDRLQRIHASHLAAGTCDRYIRQTVSEAYR